MRTFTPGQLQALVLLLGDDDHRTASVARETLLTARDGAIPYLTEAAASAEPLLRGRARLLLEEVRVALLEERLVAYAAQDDAEMDLLEGALLLAAYEHPWLDATAVEAKLDRMAAAVKERLPDGFSPTIGLRVLGAVLFGQFGFRGGSYADPDMSYLDSVLERRMGLPISLAVVYTLVGRRAGLPVSGVNLPFFFLARYETDGGPVFVDCYNRGRLLTRDDCAAIVASGGGQFADVQLQAETPRYILARMLTNLERVYRDRREQARAETAARFRGLLLGEH